MTEAQAVNFSDIRKLFPEDKWDVGFLSKDQLKVCAYSPIKGKAQEYGADYTNNIHFLDLINSIVLVRSSPDSWDYTLYKEADEILKKAQLQDWMPIYTNFKQAAVTSGLGVRARNSLIYSNKFGFDMKICVVGFHGEITDPPEPAENTARFWDKCEGCSDCRDACPVGAINNEQEPYWLDSSRCDDYMAFGDDPRIPSIKKFWHEHIHPEVAQQEVDNMKSCTTLERELSFDANGYSLDMLEGVLKDGKAIPIPFCRECQVQPRCSKWDGKFPYDEM